MKTKFETVQEVSNNFMLSMKILHVWQKHVIFMQKEIPECTALND